MKSKRTFLSQAILYKYRYQLGYFLVSVFLFLILSVDITNLPSGISDAEMRSVTTSMNFGSSEKLSWLTSFPYFLIQFISLTFLGLSKFSIVLPSLFFASLTIILFNLTTKLWFKKSISVIATIVAVTSTAFIGLARCGTPEIMLPFWTILMIYSSTKLLSSDKRSLAWQALATVSIVGLIYTPLGMYPALIAVLGGILHPRIRLKIRKTKNSLLALFSGLALVLLIPLLFYVIFVPEGLSNLFGIERMFADGLDFKRNFIRIYQLYLNFSHSTILDGFIAPMFGAATCALMLLGMYRSVKDYFTARSYVLIGLTAMFIILTILSPGQNSFILMPAMLILAVGVESLIHEWYKLFPKNPYARIAGLIPLSILFLGISIGSLYNYFYSYRYIPTGNQQNLVAIDKAIKKEANKPTTLVVSSKNKDFYEVLPKFYKNTTVTSVAPKKINHTVLIMAEAENPYKKTPSKIVTSHLKNNFLILKIYQP